MVGLLLYMLDIANLQHTLGSETKPTEFRLACQHPSTRVEFFQRYEGRHPNTPSRKSLARGLPARRREPHCTGIAGRASRRCRQRLSSMGANGNKTSCWRSLKMESIEIIWKWWNFEPATLEHRWISMVDSEIMATLLLYLRLSKDATSMLATKIAWGFSCGHNRSISSE